MNKKILIIIIPVVILIIAIPLLLIIFPKKQTEVVNPIGNGLTNLEKVALKKIPYKDEAGFEFEYPESLTLKDITGDDQITYSSLELNQAELNDKMIIKVADTDFSSVEAWLKSQEATGAGISREITVGGISGKQIQFDNPKRLITLAIKGGIMYFFQSPMDNNWNKIHSEIVSDFILSQDQPEQATADDNSPQEATLEEEIIE